VRLRNPGGAEQALQTARQVKGQLGNASVQGNNAAERKDALLTWCDQRATPQLGNHFPATEDLFGEISESYNRLALAPQMSDQSRADPYSQRGSRTQIRHRECMYPRLPPAR
jgi:hypothetical protein